jgi:signal peptidase I
MLGLILLALPAQDPPVQPVMVPIGSHPYVVGSASMEPGFVEGDVVLADRPRGDCGRTTPKIGDVVIQDREGAPWIRRVVAGPGQTVQMIDGRLFIDGVGTALKPAQEAPPAGNATLLEETLPNGARHRILDFGPGFLDNSPEFSLAADEWFLMGDSRDNAIDSRADGPVPTRAICGIVYARHVDGEWMPLQESIP